MSPTRHIVELATDDPRSIYPEGIHAVVSFWVDGDHHARRKPFSVTPAYRLPDGRIGFQVSTLSAGASEALTSRAGTEKFRFGRRWFAPEDVSIHTVARAPWDSLNTSKHQREWVLHLLTPTVFRSDDRHLPEPSPGLVFGHLRAVWAAFSNTGPLTIDFGEVDLAADTSEIEVVEIDIRGQRIPGAIGPVTFGARRAGLEALTALNALASLAEFSGVGSRTTYGLGVARVL